MQPRKGVRKKTGEAKPVRESVSKTASKGQERIKRGYDSSSKSLLEASKKSIPEVAQDEANNQDERIKLKPTPSGLPYGESETFEGAKGAQVKNNDPPSTSKEAFSVTSPSPKSNNHNLEACCSEGLQKEAPTKKGFESEACPLCASYLRKTTRVDHATQWVLESGSCFECGFKKSPCFYALQ